MVVHLLYMLDLTIMLHKYQTHLVFRVVNTIVVFSQVTDTSWTTKSKNLTQQDGLQSKRKQTEKIAHKFKKI